MEILNARPEIAQFVQQVTDSHNIPLYKITNVQTNAKGEGYLGEIFMITITDQTTHKNFDIIIKAAFQNEKIRDSAPIRLSFENEIYFYSTVAPLYQQLETEANCTGFPPLAAKCFLASLSDQTEMLALENLKVEGFEIFDKTLILDDEHVRLIFENYGRFHAYSFALRDQQPEKYEKVVEKMRDLYAEFLKNDLLPSHLMNITDIIRKGLVKGEDDVVIEKFAYTGEEIVKRFSKSITSECAYPAILHGDCWSNNMLFKYKEDSNGKKILKDMRLIDFQLIKVGSPVCDLSYFFYSGASRKEFDKLDEYLQIYHDSFSAFLKQLGSDPEKLFPLSALKSEWKLYAEFGMLMGINIIKMKLTDKGDIVDFGDFVELTNEEEMLELINKSKFDEVQFIQRCKDIAEHLVEIGAL